MNEEIQKRKRKLLELTGDICTRKLNDEYAQLCEKLIERLGQKGEVPFQRGKIEIWAAAIVYAIGSVNFLFDKSFEPHMSAEQISEYFGTNNSTVSAKARKIREIFDMGYLNPEFSTQRMTEINPLNNLVVVDGFIVPLDSIPEELQEIVMKERAEGRDIEFTTRPE